MTKKGKLDTPSMMAVEDYLDAKEPSTKTAVFLLLLNGDATTNFENNNNNTYSWLPWIR